VYFVGTATVPIEALFARYCRTRDPRLLGQVFDRAAPDLLSLALHLCGKAADAEDALQSTFVTAIERAETYDAARPLLAWLQGILARKAQQLHERRARRREQPIDDDAAHASAEPAPPAEAERQELVAHLRTQVDALPAEQRQVLLLQLQHGLQPAEIAEVLAVPPGTVRMRLHRGLQRLRALLPAGLGALLFGALSTRGLAAVRQSVLRAAERFAPVAGAGAAMAGITGVLAMKKVLALSAALLLVGALLWWNGATPSLARPAAPGTSTAVIPAVAAATDRKAADGAAAAGAGERSAVAAPTGSLRVHVIAGATGSEPLPVAGCLIQAWRGDVALVPFDDTLLEADTDTRGEVVFAGLAPGSAQVLLAADRVEQPRPVRIEAGKETQLEITRATQRVVRGVVVDPDGAPVAGAEVWVHRGRDGIGRYDLPEHMRLVARRAAISDAQGRFAVALGDREGTLGANHAGYCASFGGGYADDTGDVRLVLGRAFAALSGTVRDADGNAVPRALVEVIPAGQDSRRAADGSVLSPRVPRLARTDADGRFSFAGLPPGTNKLWATADPGLHGWRDFELAAFAQVDVELKLNVGRCMVVGTVRQADGAPARHLLVAARASLDRNGTYSTCGTRDDGTFRLDYVGEKGFVVTVIGPGSWLLAHREFAAPQRGVIRCDFELPELHDLRGHVLDPEGRPLARWNVAGVDEAEPAHGGQSTTGADGGFELPTLAGATFRLTACPFDGDWKHPAVERAGVSIGGGPIELRVPAAAMPRARVRGRLLDPEGRALEGRQVALRRAHAWIHSLQRITLSDGTFAFDGVPAGDFVLMLALRGDRERQLATFTLDEGGQRDTGDLVVAPPAVLRVEFARADGSAWTGPLPSPGLFDAAGKRVDCAYELVDGVCRLEAEPGRYRVEVLGSDLMAPAQTVELEPGRLSTLRFLVAIGRTRELRFNGDGQQHPEYRTPMHVVVRGADHAVVEQRDIEALMPDLRGFRYWYLQRAYPFGHYEVEAKTDSGLRYRGSFDVSDDLEAPTRVDIPAVQ
jgi:RNA polymerase sigma-70 factor (ECF subfamily)